MVMSIRAIQDQCFIKTLNNEPCSRTPVWIMRQAGRYLPEYRALRQKAGSFMTLCKTPELACEVTLQPLDRFRLDAAILFSDILTIPDAMGLGLSFAEGEGPKFERYVRTLSDIEALEVPEPEEKLSYVTDAIRLIKHELSGKAPLIGFSGSPWTLACYMIEGGKSQNFHQIKSLLYKNPEALHLLLNKLSQAVIRYLTAQINAGVDTVMIFDSWGGILPPKEYLDFSLYYTRGIIAALPPEVPVILYTKNSGVCLEEIAQSGCRAVGIDWTVDIQQAKKRTQEKVILQGNMDPAVLLSSPIRIEQEVKNILTSYAESGRKSGHIFNLGHGITPDIPVENVEAFIEAVHALSSKFFI
jgi:uroporphyrinogen decarboxylase